MVPHDAFYDSTPIVPNGHVVFDTQHREIRDGRLRGPFRHRGYGWR